MGVAFGVLDAFVPAWLLEFVTLGQFAVGIGAGCSGPRVQLGNKTMQATTMRSFTPASNDIAPIAILV
jgi:hypothetical protein